MFLVFPWQMIACSLEFYQGTKVQWSNCCLSRTWCCRSKVLAHFTPRHLLLIFVKHPNTFLHNHLVRITQFPIKRLLSNVWSSVRKSDLSMNTDLQPALPNISSFIVMIVRNYLKVSSRNPKRFCPSNASYRNQFEETIFLHICHFTSNSVKLGIMDGW